MNILNCDDIFGRIAPPYLKPENILQYCLINDKLFIKIVICKFSLSSLDSDQYSDMTDSDADKKRRGLRRGQRQQVNYRETSESSDNSRTSTSRVKVKPRGRPRKEHLSSDYSDGQLRLHLQCHFFCCLIEPTVPFSFSFSVGVFQRLG